jgi:hypothetical protein
MVAPTQGGLNQVASTQQRPGAPVQAGGRFDASAVQAENLEEMRNTKSPALKERIVDDLGDQREAMNAALMRMRASLDDRKNRMFDPVLMQTAAGFLKPTKTGSFGESLGYAAENAGAAAEKEMLFNRENQKLEMELLSKEQELRQQLGGDQLISALLGGPGATNAPPPAAGAVTTPTGQLRVPGTASPVDAATLKTPEQVLGAARQGRIPITDEVLLLANRVAPKMLPTLQEIRKAQEGEERNRIEREKLEFQKSSEKRKVIPRGLRTEREISGPEYAKYQAALTQYLSDGDENKLLTFYDSMGWLESEQVRSRVIPKVGEAPAPISRAKSATEVEAEKEAASTTAKGRAEAAEKMATRLGLQAEAAFENTNIANDMIGYARNNPKILQAMNRPGILGAVIRASEQGIKVGDFSVSVPAKTLAEANLDENDLAALQIFAQKYSQLQTRGRQLNRTPGEGSMSDFETRLLGGIYALPSDSQRAVILKSEALIMQGMFDEATFKLWNQKSKQPGYTYNDFLVDDDFKKIKSDYRAMLTRVREENLDLLTPKKKEKPATAPAASAPAPARPAASAPAASAPAPAAPTPARPAASAPGQPPANETYSQRLKRLQAERERQQSQGGG